MVGNDWLTSISSDKVVRSVVWDARRSHDEIRNLPERRRKRNLERRDRMKKFVTSTKSNPPFRQMIDSMFSPWEPSPLGVNEEMMEVRVGPSLDVR